MPDQHDQQRIALVDQLTFAHVPAFDAAGNDILHRLGRFYEVSIVTTPLPVMLCC